MKQLILLALILSLSACAGSPAWTSMQISSTRSEAERNNANLMKVQIGQTREEFIKIMGAPTKREAYLLPNNTVIEFLFYRTSGWSTDVMADTDDQFTPVAVVSGKIA